MKRYFVQRLHMLEAIGLGAMLTCFSAFSMFADAHASSVNHSPVSSQKPSFSLSFDGGPPPVSRASVSHEAGRADEKVISPSELKKHVFDEKYEKSPIATLSSLEMFNERVNYIRYTGFDVDVDGETIKIDTKKRFGCGLSASSKLWIYEKAYYLVSYYFLAYPENESLKILIRNCGRTVIEDHYRLHEWVTEHYGKPSQIIYPANRLASIILSEPAIPATRYRINGKLVSKETYSEEMDALAKGKKGRAAIRQRKKEAKKAEKAAEHDPGNATLPTQPVR